MKYKIDWEEVIRSFMVYSIILLIVICFYWVCNSLINYASLSDCIIQNKTYFNQYGTTYCGDLNDMRSILAGLP